MLLWKVCPRMIRTNAGVEHHEAPEWIANGVLIVFKVEKYNLFLQDYIILISCFCGRNFIFKRFFFIFLKN